MKDQDERSRNPFDYANRHSSDALDRGVTKVLELSPFRSAGSMEMTQFERHKTQQQKLMIQRAASSDGPPEDQVTAIVASVSRC